jgi:hypothetical protein
MMNNNSFRMSRRVEPKARSAPGRVLRAAGKWLAAFVLVAGTAGFGSCSGGGGGEPSYALQGSVSGLLPGQSVLLQNLGSDSRESLTISGNMPPQFHEQRCSQRSLG